MNTANLQLEGLLLALAAINRQLVEKGVLSLKEVDAALGRAMDRAQSDRESIPPANRDAVSFPIRFLRLANAADIHAISFSEIAKAVGEEAEGRGR